VARDSLFADDSSTAVKRPNVEDVLTRAQRYRDLFRQLRATAEHEPDETRRKELLELARQYERLAKRLIDKGVARNFP